jgi:glycosyltransferase involved in cell wall biosynthesis
LIRAVDSVLAQDYRDFEILVVDDSSTVDMKHVWKSFTDNRIRIIVNENNLQAGPSRNKGVELATGEFIAFLDSDDEWLPNHLSLRIAVFEDRNSMDGVYGASILYTDGAKTSAPPVHPVRKEESMLDYLLSGRLRAATPSIMVRRDAFLDVRFDESLIHHEDYNFLIRFHQQYIWGCITEPTVKVHDSTTSQSLGKLVNHSSCLRAIEDYTQDVSFKHLFNYCRSMALDVSAKRTDVKKYLDLLNRHNNKRPWNYRLKLQLWNTAGMKPIHYFEKAEWLFRNLNRVLLPG